MDELERADSESVIFSDSDSDLLGGCCSTNLGAGLGLDMYGMGIKGCV